SVHCRGTVSRTLRVSSLLWTVMTEIMLLRPEMNCIGCERGTSRAPVLLPMRDSTKVWIGSPTTSLTRLKRGEAAVLDAVG
ncbi:hypothetical protein LINPERHAP2_LOCUS37238, partial [Linum perenne]